MEDWLICRVLTSYTDPDVVFYRERCTMDKTKRLVACPVLIMALTFCGKRTQPVDLTPDALPSMPTDVRLIAFGSCNRQNLDQSYWRDIAGLQPDLWIWLGDNIYADTDDMEVMASMYAQQKTDPNYAIFRRQVPIVGIWDDHDYGVNDGGKEYPEKEASKELMLQFLDVPEDAPVRRHAGIYQNYTIQSDGHPVRLILLDTRSFRDALEPKPEGPERYRINPDGDILGEEQWQWLGQQLRDTAWELALIGGGYQFLHDQKYFEKWANFPQAHQRLLQMIDSLAHHPVILLSGDRHIAEIARKPLPHQTWPLYEVTASGLTHSYTAVNEPNQYREGPVLGQKNMATLHLDWQAAKPQCIITLHELDSIKPFYVDTVGF